MVRPAARIRYAAPMRSGIAFAASTNHAKPRAPIPAATPRSERAGEIGEGERGCEPWAANSGVVPLTETNAR